MSNSEIISDILKYVDCFGATFNFYSERNRKFYTDLGGLFFNINDAINNIIFI